MNFRKHYNENKNTLDFYTLMFYSFSQQFRFNNKGDFNMPCGNDCFSETNKEYILNGRKSPHIRYDPDGVMVWNGKRCESEEPSEEESKEMEELLKDFR